MIHTKGDVKRWIAHDGTFSVQEHGALRTHQNVLGAHITMHKSDLRQMKVTRHLEQLIFQRRVLVRCELQVRFQP